MSDRDCNLMIFRRDLRLSDNPALFAAADGGRPLVVAYIHEPAGDGEWRAGKASCRWLRRSLTSFSRRIEGVGGRLILRQGKFAEEAARLADDVGAGRIFLNRFNAPPERRQGHELKKAARESGIEIELFESETLCRPDAVLNSSGEPFRVFTPFWKRLRDTIEPRQALPSPEAMTFASAPFSLGLEELDLPDTADDADRNEDWTPGEEGARQRLARFLDDGLADYEDGRDRPGRDLTSRLSPHLHFGEIGPRQLWNVISHKRAHAEAGPLREAAGVYLRELGWREFSINLLCSNPDLSWKPLQPRFADFPYLRDEEGLALWKEGKTGFPIVDAGMRQLKETGWMHNRVRMIVASFLVKDLLVPWQEGEDWFRERLVDADQANNGASWQWVAGCGADAAPFFRIFNPVLQGERFDGDGAYVRRWVPELGALPETWIHKPWEAPDDVLDAAAITLGNDYPLPCVDHKEARQRALRAYDTVKGSE